MSLRLYRTIIADPPWEYDSPRAMVGNGGRGAAGASAIVQVDVSAQYPTMTLEQIGNLQIPAAKQSLLFLWTPNGFLCDGSAAAIVKKWGFVPKTVITYAKQKADGTPSMKTGHWFRGASEHVIFAIKGKVKRPDDFPALPTWFGAPRFGHSIKPDRIHEYAELASPGPRLEMFARRRRDGWDSMGNEIR